MKKLLTLMLIFALVFCSVVTVSAEESLPLGAMDGLRFMLENQAEDDNSAEVTRPHKAPARLLGAEGSTDSGSLTVGNLKEGVTVKAYRLVKMEKVNDSDKFSYTLNADYNAVFTALGVDTVRKYAEKSDATVIKAAQAKIDATATPDVTGTVEAGETSITLSGMPYGMYYIAIESGVASAIYNPMLILIPQANTIGSPTYDVTVTAKSSEPTLEKKIVKNGGTLVDETSATVGDYVDYQIKVKLPYYTSEIDPAKFTFKVVDEMSKGLTYDELTSISVDSTAITGITPNVVPDSYGTTTVTYDFPYDTLKDYLKYDAENPEHYLYIKYKAVLNENAVIGAPGNPNEALLTYTNDPSTVTDEGKYPTNDTPKDEAKVYTFGLDITKYELGDMSVKLAGAEFSLTKEGQAVYFKALGDGEYTAVIAGGAYTITKDAAASGAGEEGETTTEPGTTEPEPAESGTETYTATATINGETVTITGLTKTILTDSNGKLIINGLGEGTFKLTEEKAPEGYYIIDRTFDITITPELAGVAMTGKVATGGGNEAATAGIYYVKSIANSTEYTLPGTGGMGTLIFMGVSAVALALACVLLYRRRRHQA